MTPITNAAPRGERAAALDMQPETFRAAAHSLVDQIADWLAVMPAGPVMRDETPAAIRQVFGAEHPLPMAGRDPAALVADTAAMLFEHSLFNGHPRFFGYITSSPAPIGALGDLLASAINQNVGAWRLSPMATEIEAQTVRWIAELIGVPTDTGGLLVSGGNMANFVCFLAARAAKLPQEFRAGGWHALTATPRVYASTETHTWIHKAADLFGMGTDAIRWIAVDDQQRMDVTALEAQVRADRAAGDLPFLVVGTAGTVSTGAVDPLRAIAALCRGYDLWCHVDGAYGALAAQVPGAPADLVALGEADSIAVDPHKWMYAPLEAGCALVRRRDDLLRAFSHHPAYYHFDHEATNYFDLGPQNSRGFRALKVWLALRQAGRTGCLQMISDDIALARHLHSRVNEHPALEALTQHLSITTFRYVPEDLRGVSLPESDEYLERLNQDLLTRIERSGQAFLSNAIVAGRFALRACIVNFRTTSADIDALVSLVAILGREADEAMRPAGVAR